MPNYDLSIAPMEITLTEYIQKLSIQLRLWEWKHEINKGDLILFAAFGGGFTWGATLVKWEN